MSLPSVAPERSLDALVQDLAIRHRHRDAFNRLIANGKVATPAVRRGLCHADPMVRIGCCKVLDHYLDDDALPENAKVARWYVPGGARYERLRPKPSRALRA